MSLNTIYRQQTEGFHLVWTAHSPKSHHIQQDFICIEKGFLLRLFSQIIDKFLLPPLFDRPQPQLCPRSGLVPAHLIIWSTRSRWCLQDLLEETGFLCKEYKSEGHGGKQNLSRTNTAQPYLFMDLFAILVLLHSFFLLLSHPFSPSSLSFPPWRTVSASIKVRGDSHRLQWSLKHFRPSDLSPPGERGHRSSQFGVSKYGESSKRVNKMKARREMLSRPFSLMHFRLFFPGLKRWGLCMMDSGRFQETTEETHLKAELVLFNPFDGEERVLWL